MNSNDRRPVTLFTGQWTDLPLEDLTKKAGEWGYNGLEVACWGGHIDPEKAATSTKYAEERLEVLQKEELGLWAIGSHIIGQCVGDAPDPRLDAFAPSRFKGKPEEIRKWAVDTMMSFPEAAKNLGVSVVTGFLGSPIWKFWYSFPPTTDEMINEAFGSIVEIWSPIFDEFDRLGIRFALEVHPTEIAFDLYTMQRLIQEFSNRKTLGVNFDPSHLLWQGMKPELFIREFAERIYHVHMKDVSVNLDGKAGILGSHLPFGDLRRGWNFRSLGHGDVNFEEIIRELNAAGYNGPLSVEWEDNGMNRDSGAAESCRFVHNINFSPSNIEFDKDMGNR